MYENIPFPYPSDYRDAHLSRIEQSTEIIEILLNWTKKPHHILYLSGSVGTGKTYFSAAWYNHICEKISPYHIRVFKEPSFYTLLLDVIDKGWSWSAELQRVCESPFFILDDMGCDKMTDWKYSALETFIDLRLNNNTATLITSNILPHLIKDHYNPRITSRLLSANNVLIDNSGFDRRQIQRGTKE